MIFAPVAIETALKYGACQSIEDCHTPQDFHKLIFSPQGREFFAGLKDVKGLNDASCFFTEIAREGFPYYNASRGLHANVFNDRSELFIVGYDSLSINCTDPAKIYRLIISAKVSAGTNAYRRTKLNLNLAPYTILQITPIAGIRPEINILSQGEEAQIIWE